MIYQDTLRFLKHNIQELSANYQWSETDNADFFDMLHKRYSDEEIKAGIEDIQKAFTDIFQELGNLLFKYKGGDEILIKIVPYSVKPEQSQHLPALIKTINDFHDQIEHLYSDQDEQLLLEGELHTRLNGEITDSKESVNKKELLKEAIRQALKLNSQDHIFIFKHKFIVKIFQTPASYSEASLAVDYKDFFEDVDHETFLDVTIDFAMESALDFDYMDNSYYEMNAYKEIKFLLIQELTKHLKVGVDFIKPFAEYIFKKDFIQLHERIATALLYEVACKSKSAKKFLEYYSGETVLIEGKKYRIPALGTPKGGKLNLISAISVASTWILSSEKKEELSLTLHKIGKLLLKEHNTFTTLKNQFLEQQKSHASRDALAKLHLQLKEQEEKVDDINQKRQKLKHEIHKHDQNVIANTASYKTVLNSVTKALMQRKKAI